jgi:hypothetical protein
MRKHTTVDIKVTIFRALCKEHGLDPVLVLSFIRDMRAIEKEEVQRGRMLRTWAEAICRDEEWAKRKCARVYPVRPKSHPKPTLTTKPQTA